MKYSIYTDSEQTEIIDLFTRTFSDSEGEVEGKLIGGLVSDLLSETADQDLLGFVARENGQPVGSIFFTTLSFDAHVNAFLLSPVAVHTNHQGKTIGQQLIKFGLGQLAGKGVELVFTYGDPAFYSKVGFQQVSEDFAKAPFELTQPEGWLCQSLDGGQLETSLGGSRCVEAFNKSEYW